MNGTRIERTCRVLRRLSSLLPTRCHFACAVSTAATALFLTLTPSAHASDYLIEAVVFRWADGPRTDELFEQKADAPVAMPRFGQAPNNIVREMQPGLLADAVGRMRNAGSIQVVKHRAWTQSRAGKNGSPQIDLGGGGVTGWVRLYTNTYLFADVDLALDNVNATAGSGSYSTTFSGSSNTPTFTASASVPAPYRISEHRRVKFNELHYFDHPAFGVLVMISPNR